MIVDTCHMVAFSGSVTMELERAAEGLVQSAMTGEVDKFCSRSRVR